MMKRFIPVCFSFLVCPLGTALAAEPIKIGALLTFSGAYAQIGEEMANAMAVAFGEVGNSVEGREIKIIRADTQGKPNVALQQAKELVGSEGVDFLVGPVSSGESVALRDFVAESKIPMIAPNALSDDVTRSKCTPYIIPVGFSTIQSTKPIAEWLAARGQKTAYTLAPDYVGPHQLIESFTRWFTAAGGKVIGGEFTPFQKTDDFGPYLARAKDAKPDFIYVFYAGGEAIKFMKQAAAFHVSDSTKLVGPGWTVSPLVLQAEGDGAVGFLGILNYAPTIDTPENKTFQKAYQEKYGHASSEFGAQAYDAARFIMAGLKATHGKTDDHAALVKAIRATEVIGPRGPVSIDVASDHVVQNMYLIEVEKTASGPALKVIDTIKQVKEEPSVCVLQY
jgi:branched-chain amino acid transport system substrate-binding protein